MNIYVIGSVKQEEDLIKVVDIYCEAYRPCDVEKVVASEHASLDKLIAECYKKISEADLIVAVSKPDGSYGDGTTYEIEFTKFIGKPLKLFDIRNLPLLTDLQKYWERIFILGADLSQGDDFCAL